MGPKPATPVGAPSPSNVWDGGRSPGAEHGAGVSPASPPDGREGGSSDRYELITSKLNLAKPQQKPFWEMRSDVLFSPLGLYSSLSRTGDKRSRGSERVY